MDTIFQCKRFIIFILSSLEKKVSEKFAYSKEKKSGGSGG